VLKLKQSKVLIGNRSLILVPAEDPSLDENHSFYALFTVVMYITNYLLAISEDDHTIFKLKLNSAFNNADLSILHNLFPLFDKICDIIPETYELKVINEQGFPLINRFLSIFEEVTKSDIIICFKTRRLSD
jgi:hypothetical protein